MISDEEAGTEATVVETGDDGATDSEGLTLQSTLGASGSNSGSGWGPSTLGDDPFDGGWSGGEDGAGGEVDAGLASASLGQDGGEGKGGGGGGGGVAVATAGAEEGGDAMEEELAAVGRVLGHGDDRPSKRTYVLKRTWRAGPGLPTQAGTMGMGALGEEGPDGAAPAAKKRRKRTGLGSAAHKSRRG